MMKKTRVFVLEKKDDDSDVNLKHLLELTGRDLGLKLEVELAETERLKEIPVSYDLYFLHLRQIDEDALRELRTTCSKSYIVAVSGRGNSILPSDIRNLINEELLYRYKLTKIKGILSKLKYERAHQGE